MALDSTDETWCATLCQTLDGMRQSSGFSDVIIQTDGDHIFSAHACVLAAVSPVLKTRLVANRHYFYAPNITRRTWEILLQYIYSGRLEVSQSAEIPRVLQAGLRLQLIGLSSRCEALWRESGEPGECVPVEPMEAMGTNVKDETTQEEFDTGTFDIITACIIVIV